MIPRSTDYNVDALTTAPSRRSHLEVAFSVLTDSFTSSLCQFIGRSVGHMYLNNGINLVSAGKVFGSVKDLNRNKISDLLRLKEIE